MTGRGTPLAMRSEALRWRRSWSRIRSKPPSRHALWNAQRICQWRTGWPPLSVNSKSSPAHDCPIARRSCACSALQRRTDERAQGGVPTLRVPAAVFGSVTRRSSSLTWLTLRRIATPPVSRSTSDHRSSSASPMRQPVPMRTAQRGCHRVPSVTARNRWASATGHSSGTARRAFGASTLSAGFCPRYPHRTATRSARRRHRCAFKRVPPETDRSARQRA
jgi:hypothetical protein